MQTKKLVINFTGRDNPILIVRDDKATGFGRSDASVSETIERDNPIIEILQRTDLIKFYGMEYNEKTGLFGFRYQGIPSKNQSGIITVPAQIEVKWK